MKKDESRRKEWKKSGDLEITEDEELEETSEEIELNYKKIKSRGILPTRG
jgi:hypothetical protein